MLIEFSVKNYLSFKEKQTLSMVASPDDSLPQNVIHSAQGTKFNLLKSAAIYGANASGKSNLIKALNFMDQFVSQSHQGQEDTLIPVTPFKLDVAWINQPSEFEIIFLWEGIRYRYGFMADKKRVYEEWFFSCPKQKERILFERRYDESSDQSKFKFGSHWKGGGKTLVKKVRLNALFISVAAQFNHPMAQIILNWFSRKFRLVSWYPTEGMEIHYSNELASKDEFKKLILNFLKCADLGISDFNVEKRIINKTSFKDNNLDEFENLPYVLKKNILQGAEIISYNIMIFHQTKDSEGSLHQFSFQFDEESDGTQKIYSLSGPWLSVLMHGCILAVDELDARLHPLLTYALIKFFNNAQNKQNAQLIFTIHDSSLLDQELFRRDQIWFTEKNPDENSTDLYSIWDIKEKPRKTDDLRKRYLTGRYGAIPFIGDFSRGE